MKWKNGVLATTILVSIFSLSACNSEPSDKIGEIVELEELTDKNFDKKLDNLESIFVEYYEKNYILEYQKFQGGGKIIAIDVKEYRELESKTKEILESIETTYLTDEQIDEYHYVASAVASLFSGLNALSTLSEDNAKELDYYEVTIDELNTNHSSLEKLYNEIKK